METLVLSQRGHKLRFSLDATNTGTKILNAKLKLLNQKSYILLKVLSV